MKENEPVEEIKIEGIQNSFHVVNIEHPENHNTEYSKCKDGITFFSHEWNQKKDKCLNIVKSNCKNFEKIFQARDCVVKKIELEEGREFIEKYHFQGKNKLGLVCFAILNDNEILGVLSLGRHHRENGNIVVLDRMCFKSNIQVRKGASKLFKCAKKWAEENKYDTIISFSHNRLSSGKIYEILRFKLKLKTNIDYFYYDPSTKKVLSKQSQKKSDCGCPEGITERDWAEARGLVRIIDAGKTTWEYRLFKEETHKERLSRRCANQHSKGCFKHSHIRGYYKSKKNNCQIYYGSSYELKCMFDLENNSDVISYKRMDSIKGKEKWRNPDLFVTFTNANWIYEVKPKKMLEMPDVMKQIEDSLNYCKENNINFKVWTEDDSGMEEKQIVDWAKKIISDLTGDFSWIKKQKENHNKNQKKYYNDKIKNDKIEVNCQYCQKIHFVLKRSYNKNIERNGRYICESEGGKISGEMSKGRILKPNIYEQEGKKECTNCKEVKPFGEFNSDKSRRDGLSNVCSCCNRIKCTERYNNRKNKTELE